MRKLLLVVLTICAASCSLQSTSVSTEVEKKVASAAQKGDLRLIAFSGRRTVVPGYENEDIVSLKKTCGLVFERNSGDVVKSDKDIDDRNKLYDFAVAYNTKIYKLCKAKNDLELRHKNER